MSESRPVLPRPSLPALALPMAGRLRVDDETTLLPVLIRAVAEAEDLGSALQLTLQQLCAFTGWACGEAWMPDASGAKLERALAWSSAGPARLFHSTSDGQSLGPGSGLPGRVWASREPLWLQDVTFAARDAGLSAAVGVPVMAKDQVVAVLTFYMVEPRPEDDRLLQLVSAVAAQLGALVQRRRAEEGLRESEEKYRAVAETASDAIVVIDDRFRISYFNPAAQRAFGRPAAQVMGRSLLALVPHRLRATLRAEVRRVFASPADAALPSLELRGLRKDRTEFPLEVSLAAWRSREATYCTALIRDVSERKRIEERIRHLAYHDPLTGLPNRRLFNDRVRVALAQARRHGHPLAVLFLDVDRFKLINDSLGHGCGDHLLQELATRLQCCLREDDTVARLGGDEFTILLPSLAAPEHAHSVAQKILEAVTPAFNPVGGGRPLYVTCSIGLAMHPADGRDVETLVRNADTAMYKAKDLGGSRCETYTSSMNAQVAERLTLENDLRQALSAQELTVFYQPIVEVRTASVHTVEALVRWNHPTQGLLLPDTFLPIAEAAGLLAPIGQFVLRRACEDAQKLRKVWPELSVAVNLSPRQLQEPDVVPSIKRVLAETGLAPSALELEITEECAIQNAEETILVLNEIKALGVRLSIDDFGVGYSSLSHLRRLPVDTVKIDRSFVRNISRGRSDAAIVTAVIAMAHTLHLDVVAEGVESAHQMGFLGARRCDRIQGFLLSRPIPVEELETQLHGPLSRLPFAARTVAKD